MKRCTLFCAGIWPFLLFPLLLLLLVLFFHWHQIERDVANNAQQRLAEEDIQWAGIETYHRGRDVLITGTAPDEASVEQAISIVTKAKGVNIAEFHQGPNTIAPPAPALLNTIVTGNSVVLRGKVSSEAELTQILAQAESTFGAEHVINKLEVGPNTSKAPDMSVLFNALKGNASLGSLSAKLHNNALTLNGKVLNNEIKEHIERLLGRDISSTINNNLEVTAPPPPAPPPVIPETKNTLCQTLVNDLLRTGKINFQSGKSTINEESFALLNSIGDTAKQCPTASFEVSGHTDSSGNLAFNRSLSKQRAQAVVEYLVNYGLPTEQFNAVGYGPEQPIADNDSVQGRAKNRRIEFRLQLTTDLQEVQ